MTLVIMLNIITLFKCNKIFVERNKFELISFCRISNHMYTVFLSVHEKVLAFSFSKFALFVTWARPKLKQRHKPVICSSKCHFPGLQHPELIKRFR